MAMRSPICSLGGALFSRVVANTTTTTTTIKSITIPLVASGVFFNHHRHHRYHHHHQNHHHFFTAKFGVSISPILCRTTSEKYFRTMHTTNINERPNTSMVTTDDSRRSDPGGSLVDDESNNQTIKTYVVCGPSGSGKTTLLGLLIGHFKDCFQFCVSHTTRAPRNNEQDGKAYHFVDVPTFERMITGGEFVEYSRFSNNYYGTSYQELEVVKNSNKIPILDVDIRGVISLKRINFDAKYIFITTQTLDILERQLRARGTENETALQQRLKHAVEDIKQAEAIDFDFVIINTDLEQSFAQLKTFVQNDVDKLKQRQRL